MDTSILKDSGIEVEKGIELLGDLDTYNDILNDFIDGYDEKIELIKKYYADQDMPNYAIQVHSLKSDARYLGMTELADKAYEHELKSKENDLQFVNNDINSLLIMADNNLRTVKKYLGRE